MRQIDSSTHEAIAAADLLSDITLTDSTVSNQHLRIYTIVYAEHNYQRIFVYAKDLSPNGSYWCYKHDNHWEETKIGKGKAVLLSDGDKIRLCDGSSFAFRSVLRTSQCLEDASIVQDEGTKARLELG